MENPTKSITQLELERQVLKILQDDGNKTIRELSDLLLTNYYTVRKAVSDLFDEQKIKVVAIEKRSRVFGLSDSLRAKDTIPYITNILTRTQHKVTDLLAAVGNENDLQAVRAVKEMPEIIARLMEVANKASHGFAVGNSLEQIRENIQENFLILKNASSVYEQILNDPRFWTPKYLAEFVDDADYSYIDIQKANEYYDRD